MAWTLLVIAGLIEVGWAIGLKYTDGFTRPWPSVFTVAAMALSLYLLALAARAIPIGTAYAVWVGIGATGAVVLGIVLFRESADWLRLLCVGLICSAWSGRGYSATEPQIRFFRPRAGDPGLEQKPGLGRIVRVAGAVATCAFSSLSSSS